MFLFGFIVSPIMTPEITRSDNPGPFFTIAFLCPDSDLDRIAWTNQIADDLAKIGINVEVNVSDYSVISPRTWGHPGPYPVSTFGEGGFDVLFVGRIWDLDWNPTGLYDTSSITPNGDNYYQYSCDVMDDAIADYTTSITLADRMHYINEIQTILHEDLPAAAIASSQKVYPHNENLTVFDVHLWGSDVQLMTNWTISNKS